MQDKDKTRRKVLIGLTSAVGISGLPFAATPFIAAWNPSAKAKAAGAPVKLDVSKMMYGQQIQVAWRKQPVFIVRHTKESIANLKLNLNKLADPNSDEITEPYKGLYPSRSKSPEYSVFSGVCSHPTSNTGYVIDYDNSSLERNNFNVLQAIKTKLGN